MYSIDIAPDLYMYFQVKQNKKFKFIDAIFHLFLSLIKIFHCLFIKRN